ncbi:hypothetical protein HYW75_01445 [Candidatus Pacearchaeota archaeon]|nr:hypothetical protein [Candidatus Pacearchaeota archaeon]
MVNNKGWIRVVEATIMVLLIVSVLVIVSKERKISSSPDINDLLYKTLDEIAKNSILRNKILDINSNNNEKETSVNAHLEINKLIPNYLYFDLEICSTTESINDNCDIDLNKAKLKNDEKAKDALKENDVYVSERIMGQTRSSGTLDSKRIKLYAWR